MFLPFRSTLSEVLQSKTVHRLTFSSPRPTPFPRVPSNFPFHAVGLYSSLFTIPVSLLNDPHRALIVPTFPLGFSFVPCDTWYDCKDSYRFSFSLMILRASYFGSITTASTGDPAETFTKPRNTFDRAAAIPCRNTFQTRGFRCSLRTTALH